MKNIQIFKAEKYNNGKYEIAKENIYCYDDEYFTSLSFEQEPEFDEGENAAEISEYPLEEILDEFLVYVSDFYEDLNTINSKVCYLEFASDEIEDIENLLSIVGRHVYDKTVIENGEEYVELKIE